MTVAAAGPTLTSFDAQPWWMVVLEAAFLLLTTMFMLWAERRLLGRMQNRPGPNRAGPFGLLQPYADAINLALKEDIVPRRSGQVLFWLAAAAPTITAWRSAGNSTPLDIASGPIVVPLAATAGTATATAHRGRARAGQRHLERFGGTGLRSHVHIAILRRIT